MKPIFKISSETMAIVDYLIQLPIGEDTSFMKASAAVGFRFTSTSPAYQSAKRIAERDHNVVIESIRSFGFVRINATGMVERASRFFRRVRRGSRREAHVQEIAIMSNLPRQEMMKATEQLSRLRILESTAISTRKAASNKPQTEMPPLLQPSSAASRMAK